VIRRAIRAWTRCRSGDCNQVCLRTLSVRGADAEALVGGAAIAADILVAAVLVGKAAEEGLAGHRTRNVGDPVLARLFII
jgi:hypothetical protein